MECLCHRAQIVLFFYLFSQKSPKYQFLEKEVKPLNRDSLISREMGEVQFACETQRQSHQRGSVEGQSTLGNQSDLFFSFFFLFFF